MTLRTWPACFAAVVVLAGCSSATPAVAVQLAEARSVREQRSELRELVERFNADRDVVRRRYDLAWSPSRRERMLALVDEYVAKLDDVEFDALGLEGRVDHLLLSDELEHERRELQRRKLRADTLNPPAPFAAIVYELHDARRRRERPDAELAAAKFEELRVGAESTRKAVERAIDGPEAQRPSKSGALRTLELVDALRDALRDWWEFYDGYDPLVSWWCAKPCEAARAELASYRTLLRERVIGAREGEDEPIVGDPIGIETLLSHLQHERIAYSPQELIAIAEREFDWCDEQMLAASRELGCGDDWRAALEKVKALHVAPGEQPELVRELAQEALDFVEQNQLLTVPDLAKEVWRVEMMSPARQKVNPFFLGGESVIVSYPTDAMEHADKLMSLRANNRPFSRAVVHHELIPGHHLQGFMSQRYQPHRQLFSTPFWTEGWALYWEMLLWDKGFAATPEERVGMLFWRMHRCARIVFSLRFHLGEMTPQECIDYLVSRVGHERSSAEGEVRRSFNGDYSPLYQIGYMIGGLQFRALHRELVGSGALSDRAFHDKILMGGEMPVDLVRARLTGAKLERGQRATWRFAAD